MTWQERMEQRTVGVNYHVQVFTDYYNTNVKDMSMEECAEDMWGLLQSCRGDEPNPFCLVNYSAGVYLGYHDSDDADAIAVLPDLSNLQYVTPHTDLWEVLERMDNPDAHADGADDCLERFAESIRDGRDDDCLPEVEDLEEALYAYMKVACPEYTVVLRVWNHTHSEEEFWKFWKESHFNTLKYSCW